MTKTLMYSGTGEHLAKYAQTVGGDGGRGRLLCTILAISKCDIVSNILSYVSK
jgi:hypothetical protein